MSNSEKGCSFLSNKYNLRSFGVILSTLYPASEKGVIYLLQQKSAEFAFLTE